SSVRAPASEDPQVAGLLRQSLASRLDVDGENRRKRGEKAADLSCRSNGQLARIAIRPRDRGAESCDPGTKIRPAESRFVVLRSSFRRNQDESLRAATIPSGQEQ